MDNYAALSITEHTDNLYFVSTLRAESNAFVRSSGGIYTHIKDELKPKYKHMLFVKEFIQCAWLSFSFSFFSIFWWQINTKVQWKSAYRHIWAQGLHELGGLVWSVPFEVTAGRWFSLVSLVLLQTTDIFQTQIFWQTEILRLCRTTSGDVTSEAKQVQHNFAITCIGILKWNSIWTEQYYPKSNNALSLMLTF